MNELKEIFDNTNTGEKITLREVEENVYIRKKNSLQLISSKKIKTKLIARDHRSQYRE